METTWTEFEEWCSGDTDKATQTKYKQALKQLKELQPFEQALVSINTHHCNVCCCVRVFKYRVFAVGRRTGQVGIVQDVFEAGNGKER